MPAGQPFTHLCQTLSRPGSSGRADLHLHTTQSDGLYTPAQIVELGKRAGLAALAITDHDSTAGIAPARQAAGTWLEVIAGVEISAQWLGKELHLLGFFVRTDFDPLQCALQGLRAARRDRFCEMRERLRGLGVLLEGEDSLPSIEPALGRRHLADLLVRSRQVDSTQEAFRRYLGDHGPVTVPKHCLPVEEAIALIRGAGGVAAWAHPSYDCTRENLNRLRGHGLQALEVAFPGCRPGRGKALRALAAEMKLAVTGGSDCHGPDEPRRAVGAFTMTALELNRLRNLAAGVGIP